MTKRHYAPRQEKASKIIEILKKELRNNSLTRLTCLDLGSGSGVISEQLTALFGLVVALDLAAPGNHDSHSSIESGPRRVQGNGERLPFPSASFDVVVCAQVYEHTSDARRLAREIKRILAPGGLCFFSGPNRLAVMEDHYGLPFLSWLPQRIADSYLRIFRSVPAYDIAPLTQSQLTGMLQDFSVTDYTFEVLRHPEEYGVPAANFLWRLASLLSYPFGRLLRVFIPNFNWVLRVAPEEFPRTPVAADRYSRDYFLGECEGYKEYLSTSGQSISPRVSSVTRLLESVDKKRVLDVGSGRGEMLRWIQDNGGSATGLDYSAEALALSRSVLAAKVYSNCLVRADAKRLPFAAETFHRIVMADIVEHLHPWELELAIRETRRVLSSDGYLVIHTMPNTWYYHIGYPLYRAFENLLGTHLPKNPKHRWAYSDVHVNEQNPLSLRKCLRACRFDAKVWVEDYRTYREQSWPKRAVMLVVTRFPGLRLVFCDDIYAIARKKGTQQL
jgi:ubiquinone/menaquinone biosynthesis C-methylase UbiE